MIYIKIKRIKLIFSKLIYKKHLKDNKVNLFLNKKVILRYFKINLHKL